MIRFRSISIALVVAALSVCAHSQGTTGGLLYASDFANWSLPQGNTPMQGTIFYPNPSICKVTSNGYTFLAAKVGRPLTIVDGANTETFTPTAVSITTGVCMISGTMAHSHSSYSLKSGTAGAQEAIDYQLSQPQGLNVVLTPEWTRAGGSTGIVTGALKGNTGATILDQRTSQLSSYTWNGSAYVGTTFAAIANGSGVGNCAQIGTGNTITDTGAPCSSGTANIANQATGVLPLATGVAAITAQSHLDDGVTTPATVTSTEPIAAPSAAFSGAVAAGTTVQLADGHQPVDVGRFGVLCDGSHDDTAGINAAITAATGTSNAVSFPIGKTCKVSSTTGTVTLPGDNGTFNPARTCGGGGTCTTLAPETTVTMPYSILVPGGMEIFFNNSALVGTFTYGTTAPSVTQPIMLYLGPNYYYTKLHDLSISSALVGIYSEWTPIGAIQHYTATNVGFPFLVRITDRETISDVLCQTSATCITIGGWWETRNQQTDETGGYADKTEIMRVANVGGLQPYDAYAQSFDTFFDTYFWKTANTAARGTDNASGFTDPRFYGIFGQGIWVNSRKQRGSNGDTIHQVMQAQACRSAVVMPQAAQTRIEQINLEQVGYQTWNVSTGQGVLPMADPYNSGLKIPAHVVAPNAVVVSQTGLGTAVTNVLGVSGEGVSGNGNADTFADHLITSVSGRVLMSYGGQNGTYELGFGRGSAYENVGLRYQDSTSSTAATSLCLRGNAIDVVCVNALGTLTFPTGIADLNTSAILNLVPTSTWAFNDVTCGNYQNCGRPITSLVTTAQTAVTRIQGTLGTAPSGCTTSSDKIYVTDGTHTVTVSLVNGSSTFDSGVVWSLMNAGTLTLNGAGGNCTGHSGHANTTVSYRDLSNAATASSSGLADLSAATVVSKFGGGTCSGYLKSDGTCAVSSVVVASAPGDLMCAMGGDTTIGAQTITAGSSTASTITVTVAAVPNYMYVGQLITVNGATPSGYNVVSAAIVSTTSTTITYTSANNPAAWSSGGTIALACANATDALVGSPFTFANKYSVPASSVAAGSTFKIAAQFGEFTSATAAGVTLSLKYNATVLYTNGSGAITPNSGSGRNGMIAWDIVANSASLLTASLNSVTYPTASNSVNSAIQPVPVVTTSTVPLQLTANYVATGVASGTYTSGGSITGTVGQTCTLATFNNSSTATATVALTGTNTIAGGTALVVTARGNAATAAPTTATLGSGTATCSGTATITTVLGGAPGNATLMYSFVERP